MVNGPATYALTGVEVGGLPEAAACGFRSCGVLAFWISAACGKKA